MEPKPFNLFAEIRKLEEAFLAPLVRHMEQWQAEVMREVVRLEAESRQPEPKA